MQHNPLVAGDRPFAVVVGLDNFNGLQTARILAKRGIPVIGIAENPGNACAKTRVCYAKYQAGIGDGAFIGLLSRLAGEFRLPPVLFPCTDMAVLHISRNRERLSGYRFALPKEDVVETLMNKRDFSVFAERHDLPIPRTFILKDYNDLDAAIEKLTFPAILKPDVKRPQWERNHRRKIYHISGADELFSIYRQIRDDAESLIVQEWIPGNDRALFTINAYFDRHSDALCTFISQKIRQWPVDAGVASFSVEARNDAVLQIAMHLFQTIGFFGLAYLELKTDPRTGRLYIIEPNVGRPTGRSSIAEAGGVEILLTIYCDLCGLPLPDHRTQRYGNAKWIYLRRDLQSAYTYWRRGDLTIRDWINSLRGKKQYALFSLSDPLPFLLDFRDAFRRQQKKSGIYNTFKSKFLRTPYDKTAFTLLVLWSLS